MRLHISLDDALVSDLDRFAGRRQRSAFIAHAVTRTLDEERRWREIEGALGAIDDHGHEWDEDPAAWVRRGRREDTRRAG
jgi:metal-responsive CopG/Arc/MetJ family transcriptional regulator